MRDSWLLCDFHIHSNMSDGSLPIEDVVDMYGREGFDVISITDHILDSHTLKEREEKGESVCAVREDKFKEYISILWREASRAWNEYEMLLIPGIEITNNYKGYHILAIDIKEYIDPTLPVEEIVKEIHKQEAIVIACHPHYGKREARHLYQHLWRNREKYAYLFDAWEIANRDDLFDAVGLKKFNYVANSDFHEPRHLYSWKSLIYCDKNVEAVKSAIRENKNIAIYLFRKQED
ncbi:phosphotransferase [candidate division WOR-3 bacterium JGI_Cruoil_03_44_89]|mgnify:CR=1 FL=1|uniref:Phosphotransferase n=1 Tax=candidate division WOR-3 bacterium JGI_Cruoil_03_44_89 TaxID=1973748 RepID=A0A235BZM8_UNCW3|nr:MAG: phosphotransferase [candidate division WOR-3 bacterium JGI_Cruoil_03_44_89]